MIRNIVFDLGGVLIDYDPWEYILTLEYDRENSEKLYDLIVEKFYWDKMDLGEYDSYNDAINEFVKQYSEFEDKIRCFFKPGWMQVYRKIDDAERLYDSLCDAGYNIYILSNYSKEGFAYLEQKYDFIGRADGRVISSHVSCKKPDKSIYDILLKRYHLVPEDTIFIDDLKENVDMAIQCGMKGIIYEGIEKCLDKLL